MDCENLKETNRMVIPRKNKIHLRRFFSAFVLVIMCLKSNFLIARKTILSNFLWLKRLHRYST